ncbi:MAG: TerC family protein [Alphaproteobacteria bacterium]|nr:TerC family protein [Alphaproteobacteria bacterium]
MFEWITDPNIWASLLTLTILEIVLGIDNVIFLSIVSSRLPKAQQPKARMIGLTLALVLRVLMLLCIAWIIGLTAPIFAFGEHEVSWRDIILGLGGLFLIVKGTSEIHHTVEGEEDAQEHGAKASSFINVVSMIILLDLVFSLDSVITAVGMAKHIPVMIAAIVIAIIIMLLAAESVSAFIQKHLSIKMLALSFLLLIGVALVADALHFHIPRGYLYFAIAFSLGVEFLNILAEKNHKRVQAVKTRHD